MKNIAQLENNSINKDASDSEYLLHTSKYRNAKNSIWKFLKTSLGTKKYELLRARYNLGYTPNLKNPHTFNEKIIQKKLHACMDHAVILSDKHEVKKYVSDMGLAHIINKTYQVAPKFKDLDFLSLPKGFVAKTTHSGGGEGNVIIRDKHNVSLDYIDEYLTMNLKRKFGILTNERWYTKITPRVLVEELMQDESGQVPADYKFFCFHGKCRYIQVDVNRFTDHKRSFFNEEWVFQDFSLVYESCGYLPPPQNLDEMICYAEMLSDNLDFVRVDLYSFGKNIRFGELTFAPESGWGKFSPYEADVLLGDSL